MPSVQSETKNISILEVRNYLLKPEMTLGFSDYFNTHFVAPMARLGGYTLGEFKIPGVNNRFVWLRGFADMDSRLRFLNDFYINSPAWKQYGKGANDMMINSDNVYLLRPLTNGTNLLKKDKAFTVIDFYICNSTLDKTIDLFNARYIRFLETVGIRDMTLWVSEMSENKFPQLPVFQDRNLLVGITTYQDESEYRTKERLMHAMPKDLKTAMQELITTSHTLFLENLNATAVVYPAITKV